MFTDDCWLVAGADIDVMEVWPQVSGGWRGYLRESCTIIDANYVRVGGGRELSRLMVEQTGDRTNTQSYSDAEIAQLLRDLGHEEEDAPSRLLLVRKAVLSSWRYFSLLKNSEQIFEDISKTTYDLGVLGMRISTLDYYLGEPA